MVNRVFLCRPAKREVLLGELAVVAALVACPLRVAAAPSFSLVQTRAQKPADFSTLSAAADAARAANRLDEAAPLYRKALALRPGWKEGWWALGTILYEQESHADAAGAFRRLVTLDAKNGTAHLMLALCEYQLDRDAAAMEHVQAAKTLGVQKDGDLPHVLSYHEAMLHLRAGRYERALEVLRPLVGAGVEDENLDLALGMGVLLMRPRNAPPQGSSAGQIVMRAGRAERHYLMKAFDAAGKEYAALVREVPAFPNIHYAYGRFLLGTDDLENAVTQFLSEIENQPEHVRARMSIAAARYRVDSAAGIRFAREVVTLQPRYPFGHYLLGLLYFDVGDIDRAIPELEAAAGMVPAESQFQFALGNAYSRAGRKEDAARARAAFIRLRKDDSKPEPGAYDTLRRLNLDDAAESESKGRSIKSPRN